MNERVRRIVISVLIVGFIQLLSSLAQAQERSRIELFSGYSYARFRTFDSQVKDVNINGWQTSLTANITDLIAFETNLSGHYGSISNADIKVHTLMFGLRFSFPPRKFTPYSRALFGVARISADAAIPGITTNTRTEISPAATAGGGFGIKINDKLSLRAFQIDYTFINFGDDTIGMLQASSGIVFHFGRK